MNAENFNVIYYPDEIAEILCNLAFDNPNQEIINDCEEALFQLKMTADNPYNSDYYRTLYQVFEKITEVQRNDGE